MKFLAVLPTLALIAAAIYCFVFVSKFWTGLILLFAAGCWQPAIRIYKDDAKPNPLVKIRITYRHDEVQGDVRHLQFVYKNGSVIGEEYDDIYNQAEFDVPVGGS